MIATFCLDIEISIRNHLCKLSCLSQGSRVSAKVEIRNLLRKLSSGTVHHDFRFEGRAEPPTEDRTELMVRPEIIRSCEEPQKSAVQAAS